MHDHARGASLTALFRPRSIAVVGASPRGGYGMTTLENLRAISFPGTAYAVHPSAREVAGVAAVPSLFDLPETPDAVVVAVPARTAPAVLADARQIGVRAGVLFASGFAETGAVGVQLQNELAHQPASAPTVLGPNCLGLVNYAERVAMWGITMPFHHSDRHGGLALVGQSGNMTLTAMASSRVPTLRYAVSVGNQAQVDVTDVIEFALTDSGVRAVAVILEGLADIARFRRVSLRAADVGVPIVVLKVGRSERGSRATIAHTGTLAGFDQGYDELFRECGVVRVRDLDELAATCTLLERDRRAAGPNVGVFASSGGECGLVADLASDVGMQLPPLGETARAALRGLLPEFGAANNPLDLTAGGWGQRAVYETAAVTLAGCADIDAVVAIGDAPRCSPPVGEVGWSEMLGGLAQAAAATDKPIALVTTHTDVRADLLDAAAAVGVPVLCGLAPAVAALAAAGRYGQWRATRRRDRLEATTRSAPTSVVPWPTGTDQQVMGESDAKRLLSALGLSVPDGDLARSAEQAAEIAVAVGFPVAVKVEARGLAHKSDVGGVMLDVRTPEAASAAYDKVTGVVDGATLVGARVERMLPRDGVELILGGRRDPVFGPLLVVGIGGVLTELIRDTAIRLLPAGEDVLDMLEQLKGWPLLRGYRGSPPADIDAVVRAATVVSGLLQDPRVSEIDINPLLVLPEGRGCVALDALVVTGEPAQSESEA